MFACEISSILGRMPLKNDLKLKLLQDLRLDELDRLEIVMEAEAIWAARLLPERFLQGDIEQVLEPFSTLEDIISAAHNLADSYREKPKR